MYSPIPTRNYGLVRSTAVTHPSLHIRDVHDAHILLEAVRLNMLPLLKRRLLASERDELRSGHVYVWEEAQDDGGLLRWTDGRRWSQSRMRGDYLFYEEKIETTQNERDAKAARRARRASDPNALIPPPVRRKDRPSKPNGLTKQTYSVTVNVPGSPDTRKWHVVAYFSAEDYARLPLIENYAYLRNIQVPSGIFFSNKILCSRLETSTSQSDESETREDLHKMLDSPRSPSFGYMPPILSPHYSSVSPTRQERSLPPISLLGPQYTTRHQLPYPLSRPHICGNHSMRYTPLSSEDRRALEKLKVVI